MSVFIVGQQLFQLMFFVESDPTLNKDYLILSYLNDLVHSVSFGTNIRLQLIIYGIL